METKYGAYGKAIQAQIDMGRVSAQTHGYDFKERTVDNHNIGDFVGAVLAIDNEEEAREFYEAYTFWMLKKFQIDPDPNHTPEQVVRSNIGWCFGEGMEPERIAMWRRVSGAAHPVFG